MTKWVELQTEPTTHEEQNRRLPKKRHWSVVSVFESAIERGLKAQSWKAFSLEIKRVTGIEIPPGTLKYWYSGHSEPKISELEAMAAAVGLEVELMVEETRQ